MSEEQFDAQIPAEFEDLKVIFIDTEFTGEHAGTTLISLAMVRMDGGELYLTLNDYEGAQVTNWLEENVLSMIDPAASISSPEAYFRIKAFLDAYAEGERLYVVSAGLAHDLILFLELFKYAGYQSDRFHSLHDLPEYLSHFAFIDLNTLFRAVGISPPLNRESFVGNEADLDKRHNALHDARVVRKCFLKLAQSTAGQALLRSMER